MFNIRSAVLCCGWKGLRLQSTQVAPRSLGHDAVSIKATDLGYWIAHQQPRNRQHIVGVTGSGDKPREEQQWNQMTYYMVISE